MSAPNHFTQMKLMMSGSLTGAELAACLQIFREEPRPFPTAFAVRRKSRRTRLTRCAQQRWFSVSQHFSLGSDHSQEWNDFDATV